jgi:hypothetical protein
MLGIELGASWSVSRMKNKKKEKKKRILNSIRSKDHVRFATLCRKCSPVTNRKDEN